MKKSSIGEQGLEAETHPPIALFEQDIDENI